VGGDDRLQVARDRLATLQKPGESESALSATLIALTQQAVSTGKAQEALRLQRLITDLGLPPPSASSPGTATPATSAGSQLLRILGILFFLVLLGAGLVLLLGQLQKREKARRRRPSSSIEALGRLPTEPGEQEVTPPVQPEEPAFARFESSYKLGDEGYDVSYSIESATGEFLGECGVSALERVDMGEPGRFTAFDIWLFDKLDARTETKVLLSERAFADQALRDRLADRGEPVLAEPGQVVTLDTENLKLAATITELGYEGASDSGVFARLATRLEIVPKGRSFS